MVSARPLSCNSLTSERVGATSDCEEIHRSATGAARRRRGDTAGRRSAKRTNRRSMKPLGTDVGGWFVRGRAGGSESDSAEESHFFGGACTDHRLVSCSELNPTIYHTLMTKVFAKPHPTNRTLKCGSPSFLWRSVKDLKGIRLRFILP